MSSHYRCIKMDLNISDVYQEFYFCMPLYSACLKITDTFNHVPSNLNFSRGIILLTFNINVFFLLKYP